MNLLTYAYTNIGSRMNNEDSMYSGSHGWVVADGLGGHDCGEVASRIAVDMARDFAEAPGGANLTDEGLIGLCNAINRRILEQQRSNPKQSEMRTTFAAAFSSKGMLRYIHVGDSRLYFFRGGRIFRQTRDHSVSFALAASGEIPFAEIRSNDDRNKLVKVMGNSEELGLKAPDPILKLGVGDAFLICSDGFWEYVYEAEMEMDLAKSSTPEQWMRFMLKRLLLRSINDNDNYTAICGMVR